MDTKTDGGGMMTGVEVETAQNGKAYRKGVCLYYYKKSKCRTIDQTGTTVIWKDIFSKNTSVGTTKYESTGKKTGRTYGRCVCASLFLFLSDSQIGKRI